MKSSVGQEIPRRSPRPVPDSPRAHRRLVRTALMQVVSEELQVPPEKIQVADLDTEFTPFDRGTHASSGMTVMGRAVENAARDARAQLLGAAASVFQVPESEIEIRDGRAWFEEKGVTFREILARHFGDVEGEIIEPLVENGQPVEYGEPLFRVRLTV